MNNQTLFGGRTVGVVHEDGSAEEILVRQLRLMEYEAAFRLLEDEISLTALICNRDKGWINTLQPEYYETLQAAAREVNAKGFFSYAERRNTQMQQRNEKMFATLATLPPEALKQVMEIGSANLKGSSSVSGPRPR